MNSFDTSTCQYVYGWPFILPVQWTCINVYMGQPSGSAINRRRRACQVHVKKNPSLIHRYFDHHPWTSDKIRIPLASIDWWLLKMVTTSTTTPSKRKNPQKYQKMTKNDSEPNEAVSFFWIFQNVGLKEKQIRGKIRYEIRSKPCNQMN